MEVFKVEWNSINIFIPEKVWKKLWHKWGNLMLLSRRDKDWDYIEYYVNWKNIKSLSNK